MKNLKLNIINFLLALCLLLSGCKSDGVDQTYEPTEQEETSVSTVEAVMANMTLSDMVYQMMFVTPESITNVDTVVRAGETTRLAIEKYPVGGIVYFAKNLKDPTQTTEMIKNTQNYTSIPLFIAVDEEGGSVARLGKNKAMGTTQFPPMRTIGDLGDYEKAYEVGETLAKDLKKFGFNVDFAPVADVYVNKLNSEIGNRSFGTDPVLVSGMIREVTKGLEENKVSATLKHFPGHGSTYANSHTGYSESTRTYEELKECELLPFEAGIEAGADFVMVSHMTLVNATEEKVPCSVSKEVITGLLLEELGYKGIVITDSFSMGAITEKYSPEEAAVKTIEAGADMILMTPDVKKAHDGVIEAVEKGIISRERIEESVRKILNVKYEKGIMGKFS